MFTNIKRIFLAVYRLGEAAYRLEEGQREILARLNRMEMQPAEEPEETGNGPFNDKWLQDGIDNILGYQWPPKKEGNK